MTDTAAERDIEATVLPEGRARATTRGRDGCPAGSVASPTGSSPAAQSSSRS